MEIFLRELEARLERRPIKLEQATGLAFRFVIGRFKDVKKMAE